MTQVSRRLINKKTEGRIFSLFISSIVASNSREIAVALVEDLLTPTEKVMLSKRFSVAFMLLEGYDYRTIENTLKVSKSTIGIVSTWLKTKGGGFRKVIEKIKKEEALKGIWEDLKEGIEELLASSRGVNWSRSKSMLWQTKKNRQKPF